MRRLATAVALGLAALAFAADDPNAPLANTKAQLQALKKDEAAQRAGSPGGPKLNLPSLATPGADLAVPQPARDEGETKERKRSGQKDWLLDGFDKLDRKRSPSATKRDDDDPDANDTPLDPNDPHYFLRLYERQRAQRHAKQSDAKGGPAGNLKVHAADPFAPFIKDWLANSPVRDVLEDVRAKATTDNSLALPMDSERFSAADTRAASQPTSPASAPNPFVQALGLPAPEPVKTTDARRSVVEMASNVPPPAPSAHSVYDLPERPKTDLRRALPPPPSEDKKYFPQLKKF